MLTKIVTGIALACVGISALTGCRSGPDIVDPVEITNVVWMDSYDGTLQDGSWVLVPGEAVRLSLQDGKQVRAIDRKGSSWIEAHPAPEYGSDVFAVRAMCPPGCRPRVGPGPRDEPGFVHCDCSPDIPEMVGGGDPATEGSIRLRPEPCQLRINSLDPSRPLRQQLWVFECVDNGTCSGRCVLRFARNSNTGILSLQCVCR